MKSAILSLAVLLGTSLSVSAHDEGHGPKLSDAGKFGGVIAPVVVQADLKKGSEAKLTHKAELSRSSDGTVRVYMYDASMKNIDLKAFEPSAKATVEAKAGNKEFSLEKKGNVFTGKMPKPEAKPYNIEVIFTKDGKKLLAAFENLD